MVAASFVALFCGQSLPYADASLPAAARAKDLVSRMTLEEKVSQCMMDAPAIPRLGVPKYHYWSEALHGIANNGYATVFPQAIALAATWDPNLMHQVAAVISTEARAKHLLAASSGDRSIFKGLTLWSPNVNMFRDPRWGRGQETYGEDPYLTSRMGVAFVQGIQGDDPKYLRAVSTPKHFAVHSGPEPLRHGFDAKVTERELRDYYLPAFEACVREGRAASIMSAYSGFNGVPATGSSWLLTKVLRDEWGFDGAVVSDVDSVGDILYGHHAVKDLAEASAMAIKAGNDECSGGSYQALTSAVQRGLASESDVDRAAVRLLTLRFRLGMFDTAQQCPYNQILPSVIDAPDHEKLSLHAAEESLVLLKNNGVLPLRRHAWKRVAILGPTAASQAVLVGNYNGIPARPVTLFDGLKRRFEKEGAVVEYSEGCAMVNRGNGVGSLPRGSLFSDKALTSPGLKGEVFDNLSLSGSPSATRTDRHLSLHWSQAQPQAGLPNKNCSVRWTGCLSWPSDGAAALGVAASGGVRLYLDGKLVIDKWSSRQESAFRVNWRFTKGVPVAVTLEFCHAGGAASIELGSDEVERPIDSRHVDEIMRKSDLVVLTLGITPQLEGEEMPVRREGFAGGDRTSIMLPAPQRELLKRARRSGRPVVVILTSGSAIAFDERNADAALVQWYSGEQGGTAVANVLFGDADPGGRLPVTFYRKDGDLPPFENYHLEGRTYRFFKGRPLYPFGYGLSYASFTYGKASLSEDGETWTVSLPVKNTSRIKGESVVQVYARHRQKCPDKPQRRLAGFVKVLLNPGEEKVVKVRVTPWALKEWNADTQVYVVQPLDELLEVGPWAGRAVDVLPVTLGRAFKVR